MITLNINDIKPGMILAHPVRNHQGILLLEAGARVSKKNIRILKSWGILEATVQGNAAETQDRIEDTELRVKASIEKELKEKFCDVLDDPVMGEIFNAASKQLTRDFQKNENENERY